MDNAKIIERLESLQIVPLYGTTPMPNSTGGYDAYGNELHEWMYYGIWNEGANDTHGDWGNDNFDSFFGISNF